MNRGRAIRAIFVVGMLLVDALAIALSFGLAFRLIGVLDRRARLTLLDISIYQDILVILELTLIPALALYHMYLPKRGVSRIDLLHRIFIAVSVGNVLAIAATAFFVRDLEYPRSLVVYAWALTILLVWVGRMLLDLVLRRLRRLGFDEQRVLVVGAGEPGHIILDKIRHAPELGYKFVGFVDDLPLAQPASDHILGGIADLPNLIRRHGIGDVIIALPSLSHQQLLDIVASCASERVNIKVLPDMFQIMSSEVTTSEFSGLPLLQVRDVQLRGWNLAIKRAMDLVLSALGIVLLSPLMMAIALAIKLTSPGPVFFTQERVGLDGRPFQLLKFRSMRPDAERETGPVWAGPTDQRRTRIGAIIRRLSLDELPQLVNVLLGEMSLVGPRPERPYFVEQFSRVIPRYADRHREKAGMTGWAQVNGLRGQTSIEERTRYDLFYVENWSITFDIKILLKTIATVFRDRNAY